MRESRKLRYFPIIIAVDGAVEVDARPEAAARFFECRYFFKRGQYRVQIFRIRAGILPDVRLRSGCPEADLQGIDLLVNARIDRALV